MNQGLFHKVYFFSVKIVLTKHVTKLPVLRGEIYITGVYWRRSAEMYIVKQTAQCYSPYVSKVLVTRLPALRGRNGLHWYIVATQRSTCTFWNRRRGAVCRVFQNSSWRSSRCFVGHALWNRRRCAVCRVFQKSSWRSSRRFVEKWVVWMYIKDAALKRHNLKQTARCCVPCVSKVFVTKLPSLRGEMGCMDVY